MPAHESALRARLVECIRMLSRADVFKRVQSAYGLHDYPEPRALSGALKRKDRPAVDALIEAHRKDPRAFEALLLVLSPMLFRLEREYTKRWERRWPHLSVPEWDLPALVWIVLVRELLGRSHPAAEIEGRLRNRLNIVVDQTAVREGITSIENQDEIEVAIAAPDLEARLDADAILSSLNPRERRVLEASAIEEMTETELGEELQKQGAAVEIQIRRAKASAREISRRPHQHPSRKK